MFQSKNNIGINGKYGEMTQIYNNKNIIGHWGPVYIIVPVFVGNSGFLLYLKRLLANQKPPFYQIRGYYLGYSTLISHVLLMVKL